MGMIALKCPGCGENIELDDSREFGFCNYCGTKVMQDKIVVEHKGSVSIDETQKEKNLEKRLIDILSTSGDFDRYLIGNKCEEILMLNPNNAIAKYVFVCNQYIKTFSNKTTTEYDTALEVEISLHLKSVHRAWRVCISYIKNSIDRNLQDQYVSELLSFSIVGLPPQIYYGVMTRYIHDVGDEFYVSLINELEKCFCRNIEAYTDGENLHESIVVVLVLLAVDYPELKDLYLQKINSYKAKYPEAKISSDSMNLLNGASSVSTGSGNSSYSSGTSSASSGGGGCYVATAVYGSYDCPQVWTLRRYRDYSLALTWYGRLFIALYYAISPTIVKWFGNTNWFNKMWKGRLDKMVKRLQKEGFENTPYQDKY